MFDSSLRETLSAIHLDVALIYKDACKPVRYALFSPSMSILCNAKSNKQKSKTEGNSISTLDCWVLGREGGGGYPRKLLSLSPPPFLW